MLIEQVTLQNFRNFSKKEFAFRETSIIIGPNASGKTNVLEAINLIATGKSFRAGREEEMISGGRQIARVSAVVLLNSEETKLEVVLTRGELDGSLVKRKSLLLNSIAKRLYNFAGNLKTVLFGPWDLTLVTGSPSGRRSFLDSVLSQTDREYYRSLLSYEKGLRQRNRILYGIREGRAERGQLAFWDRLLIKNGNYVSLARGRFIDFANSTDSIGQEKIELEYDKNGISEERLKQYAEEEVAAAATLVGPHRDDIKFKLKIKNKQSLVSTEKLKIGDRDLAVYGSRGEQRMSVLWLKLAELKFVEYATGEKPVLLLDDIFSELDHKHRGLVMGVVQNQQTILTTADGHTIESLKATADIIELS